MSSPMTASVTLDELHNGAALAALRPEWSELWSRSVTASPFQTAEWLLPWWYTFGVGDLWALAIRANGRLVGLAPWFLRERCVSLIGTGNSDYLDLLAEDGQIECVTDVIANYLSTRQADWDRCDFQRLPPDSPLLRMKVPSEWRDEVTPGEACPVLKFPDGTGELSMLIPPNLRQNLRFYQKRAARLGAVRFERATSATLEELFEQFLRLHAARWATQDLPGVLGNPRVRQFQRTTAEEFLRCGRLRLSALRIGGRVIAVFYGFRGRSDVCFYLSGFDPEYSRVSPGTLLIGQAIDDALQDGAAEFNFLRGRESYKYLWGATDRPCYRRRIERSPSLAGLRARSP